MDTNPDNKNLNIGLNSEDEDYSDLPSCGTTGDPAHKIQFSKAGGKNQSNQEEKNKCLCEGERKEAVEKLCSEVTKEEEKASEPAETVPPTKKATICYKCKEVQAKYKYRQEFACSKCFEGQIDHKFRANLRLRVGLDRDQKVLVCLSGGANSLTMAQLVSNAIHNVSGKKMFFQAELLWIDESSIIDDAKNDEENKLKMLEFAKKLNLKLNIINLTDIYQVNESITAILNDKVDNTKTSVQKLRELLASVKGQASCREDIISSFKNQLLIEFAFRNGYDKILFGSSGQRLASKIFTLFAKGRAASADTEIQFAEIIEYSLLGKYFNLHNQDDVTYSKKILTVGRPMKDFLNKDILNYLHNCNILSFLFGRESYLCETEKANLKLPGNGSINWIMEDFIDNIQENFISTTHTILHTSEKIIKKFEPYQGIQQRCPLCFQFRDQISNILEIETYDQYLANSINVNQDESINPDSLKKKYLESEKISHKDKRELILCFGCRRILQSRKDASISFFDDNLLPPIIIARSKLIADSIEGSSQLL